MFDDVSDGNAGFVRTHDDPECDHDSDVEGCGEDVDWCQCDFGGDDDGGGDAWVDSIPRACGPSGDSCGCEVLDGGEWYGCNIGDDFVESSNGGARMCACVFVVAVSVIVLPRPSGWITRPWCGCVGAGVGPHGCVCVCVWVGWCVGCNGLCVITVFPISICLPTPALCVLLVMSTYPSVLQSPVVTIANLDAVCVMVLNASSLHVDVLSRAKSDMTWDQRFVALGIVVECASGRMTKGEAAAALVQRAPYCAACLVKRLDPARFQNAAPVLHARACLVQWTKTGIRRFMGVEIRPTLSVATDTQFLCHAASLRAGLEVVSLAKDTVSDVSYADAVCTSPMLYPSLRMGSAHVVLTRMLVSLEHAFDPSVSTPGEICMADEILLLAVSSSLVVTESMIRVSRMRGHIERARVIAAMFHPSYDPRARVTSLPSLVPYSSVDVSSVRDIIRLRAGMGGPSLSARVESPSSQLRALPASVRSVLRAAEAELLRQCVSDWYEDMCVDSY